MKRLLLISIMLFVLEMPKCLPPVQAAEEELLDRVVAVVNDEVITQAELDTFLRPVYEEYRKEYSGEALIKAVNEVRQKILNQMIEDKLVYQEAVRQEIVVKDEEVDKEFEEFKSRLEKPEDLEMMLEREGLTLKALRERLKKQAMIRQLQDREVRSRVVVSPTEVEDFFRNNPDKFKAKERIKVRSLTIKKSEEARSKGLTDEKAKQRIELLQQKIKLYRNFDQIVKDFSEDSLAKQEGLGDWIERGTMIESVDNVIFNTPVGQMTGIVETPIGYHIFRIEAKEPEKTRTFEEVKDQIGGYLFQQESNERFRAWMEELKKLAYISIK
ncbi:MAG TPA: peptidyl-prolyl cis-trans isomerase [Candidatus Omnitrophota bacterium]|nr:peptidyl-prolyl cis-trans isomerase [Candidatus Omnitrophota bacterium]HRY84953.1 peptidyl-prolyl cis-trans isomerase [Candidatus Omnitrophota bacterium]